MELREERGELELTSLEERVFAELLRGDDPGIRILRDQLRSTSVTTRSYSGVGFVSRLSVDESQPTADTDVLGKLPRVYATHPQVPGPVEFVLDVRDGRLHCLEAYCGEGLWPADESAFTVQCKKTEKP